MEAAGGGHLDCLKYAHENGCKWDKWTWYEAARKGQLECLKYALENGAIFAPEPHLMARIRDPECIDFLSSLAKE